MTTVHALAMTETNPGVIEVEHDGRQIGLITYNPEPGPPMAQPVTHYATYANGDETVPCAGRGAALECIRLQHAVVQRLARSIRSIRPASTPGIHINLESAWDRGYNQALRDVERLLREVVGPAPEGEGYTAITRDDN